MVERRNPPRKLFNPPNPHPPNLPNLTTQPPQPNPLFFFPPPAAVDSPLLTMLPAPCSQKNVKFWKIITESTEKTAIMGCNTAQAGAGARPDDGIRQPPQLPPQLPTQKNLPNPPKHNAGLERAPDPSSPHQMKSSKNFPNQLYNYLLKKTTPTKPQNKNLKKHIFNKKLFTYSFNKKLFKKTSPTPPNTTQAGAGS